MINRLFATGLDTLSISIYDGPAEYDKFKVMVSDSGLTKEQVILRRRYEHNGNFGLTISNRAGLVDSNKYRADGEEDIEIASLPLKKSCYYPFYQMVIDYEGPVIMCAHDWKKEKIIGNATEQNIFDIWQGNEMKKARLQLIKKSRNFLPCKNCDVKGDVMGGPNFEAWAKFYAK
jgi:radical SAM protein with 4Fe4S-binding SPASM domain